MNRQRLDFLDIAKGITVLWVVWMHMEMPMHIWACFQMPLFFFLSGTLYRQPQIENTKAWFKKKSKSLLIPALTFFCISLIIILLKQGGKVSGSNLFWKIHTVGSASIIWFLEAMFLYLCFHYTVTRWLKWKYWGITISLLIYPLGYYFYAKKMGNIIPGLYLDNILVFWFYFELGCLRGSSYNWVIGYDKGVVKKRFRWLIATIAYVFIVCTPYLNEFFLRRIIGGNYLYPIYIIPFNLGMIYLIVLFSHYFEKFQISKIWKFYGINSLVVYLAHWPIYMFLVTPWITAGMDKYCAFIIVILMVTACIYFFNSYCPFLIGKNK